MTEPLTPENIVRRAAMMGLCSQTHHEHLMADARKVRVATLDVALPVPALEAARSPDPLVCALCLFVGDSEDPRPVTILNGTLVCEPHNGYFQGGDHVLAIIAWKREHPEGGRP